MLDVFTRREREGPLAAAATENRPERHTHKHTRVFEEKKSFFFLFFQPAHIHTHIHTDTINDKKNGKIKKHVGRHRCAVTTYANLGQNASAHTHTHTQLHIDCVDLYVMGRERERRGNYLIMNIAFFGHTLFSVRDRKRERELGDSFAGA